ncbi:unnamed protein product [Arctogadus glacialis]
MQNVFQAHSWLFMKEQRQQTGAVKASALRGTKGPRNKGDLLTPGGSHERQTPPTAFSESHSNLAIQAVTAFGPHTAPPIRQETADGVPKAPEGPSLSLPSEPGSGLEWDGSVGGRTEGPATSPRPRCGPHRVDRKPARSHRARGGGSLLLLLNLSLYVNAAQGPASPTSVPVSIPEWDQGLERDVSLDEWDQKARGRGTF